MLDVAAQRECRMGSRLRLLLRFQAALQQEHQTFFHMESRLPDLRDQKSLDVLVQAFDAHSLLDSARWQLLPSPSSSYLAITGRTGKKKKKIVVVVIALRTSTSL